MEEQKHIFVNFWIFGVRKNEKKKNQLLDVSNSENSDYCEAFRGILIPHSVS